VKKEKDDPPVPQNIPTKWKVVTSPLMLACGLFNCKRRFDNIFRWLYNQALIGKYAFSL
jgi:hypothetical protein